jgi:hypothetical protein
MAAQTSADGTIDRFVILGPDYAER